MKLPINFFICKLFLFYGQRYIPAIKFGAKCAIPKELTGWFRKKKDIDRDSPAKIQVNMYS